MTHGTRHRALTLASLLVLASAACGNNDAGFAPSATGGSSTGGASSGTGGSATAGASGTAAIGGTGAVGGSTAGGAGSGGAGGASAGAGVAGGGAPAGGAAGALGGGGDAAGANGGAAAAGNGGASGGSGQAGVGGSTGGSAAGQAGAGGRGGGAGTGGSAGASGFNPCPATGDCKILPLGDSITDGLGVTGGGSYRVKLFSLALADGKHITYVGRLMNGPTTVDGQPFPRSHEGYSGWTISQIDGIVPSPALNPSPHIVLLHIGTNDINQMLAGGPDRLGTLIDQITTALPNALLVVAQIIPLPFLANDVRTFNAALPALVQTRASAGKHVVLVDQFTGFPTSELADGVHPNATGYERMARVWYPAISGYLH